MHSNILRWKLITRAHCSRDTWARASANECVSKESSTAHLIDGIKYSIDCNCDCFHQILTLLFGLLVVIANSSFEMKRERERKREKKFARIELRISENCLSAAHQRNHRLRNREQEREIDREKEKIGHVWHVLYELCNNLCALKWRRWHVDEFALFALHSLFHSLAPFFFLSFSHSTFFSLINGNVNSENQNDKE